LISISAGDWPDPVPDLETEVELAADRGTLCFFAAGNRRSVLYPARYPACLAVAALGQAGNAPAGTTVEYMDLHVSEWLAHPLYLWGLSARGAEVEFCAPGVGVIWNDCGMAARASVGSSYACPIAVGVAGRILSGDVTFMNVPRDRRRYTHGVQVLASSCRATGSSNERNYWKYGRLHV
jgi:Subtilase family